MKVQTIAETAGWIARQRGAVSLVAVLDDGEEQAVSLGRHRRRFHIAATAAHDLAAYQLRALAKDGAVIATLPLRAPSSPVEIDAPVSSSPNEMLAGLTAVAKVIRDATKDAYESATESHKTTVSELVALVKLLGERHAQSEKLLADARELLLLEREQRIADAAALASVASESGDQQKQLEMVQTVIGMAMQAKAAAAAAANGATNGVSAHVTPPPPPKTPLKKN